MDSKITDFIEMAKNDIVEYDCEDEYCIVITSNNLLAYIYKTLDDFIEKCENDIKGIHSSRSIDFQLWIFD